MTYTVISGYPYPQHSPKLVDAHNLTEALINEVALAERDHRPSSISGKWKVILMSREIVHVRKGTFSIQVTPA